MLSLKRSVLGELNTSREVFGILGAYKIFHHSIFKKEKKNSSNKFSEHDHGVKFDTEITQYAQQTHQEVGI